ncbi:LamG-like jellyroll fold domain-containing protein [Pedobacter hiemivivus]|uniref:DUF4983 domain-containing protein n=1 Tax=Pedobacter hiemivivus TaxID=2530454 RepID=A0A4R0NG30_9SPHI|nr:LamG-like jellyroll fold domain-containing protein [Pedobacter hiemivivus]TCC99489.1 DUF4983 domain-containing protein [Pedobacter hiemivivus]
MRNKIVLFLAVCITLGLLGSCQDKFKRLLPEKDYVDAPNVNAGAQKVLYVIVDGARGLSVKDAPAPNIKALTQKATYSWTSLSDELYNDASSWADMLTGVGKDKHGVYNETLIGSNLSKYPTIITRIKSARPETRISSFSASDVFKEKLATGADVRQSFSTDAAVKSAVVTELSQQEVGIVIAEFGGVNVAGKTYGYDLSFPEYKTAITSFDSYVGEMVAALKARPTYNAENWLIVVTSSRGGAFDIVPADGTVFSNAQINTFTIFSSPKYNLKYIDKPYTGNRYDGTFLKFGGIQDDAISARVADPVANDQIFNFGDTAQFTIELKVKKINRGTTAQPNYDYSYPAILSKRASNTDNSSIGWTISLDGKSWAINFGKPSAANFSVRGRDINDGNWHTLGVVVENRDLKRYIKTFTDGVFNGESMLPDGWGPIDLPVGTDLPNLLTLGYIPGRINTGQTFNGFISDVRIWRKALTNEILTRFACDTYVLKSHPNFKSLAGYWPCTESAGNQLHDNSGTLAHFSVEKGNDPIINPLWVFNSSLICPVSATNLASTVPASRDAATQILSWMSILPKETWKLDGRVWLNQ